MSRHYTRGVGVLALVCGWYAAHGLEVVHGAEGPEGPVASLVATYMQAFSRHQHMRVVECFADSYFKDKGILAADMVADLRSEHPKEGAWHTSLVKLEAQMAEDGQSAKGYFFCRVGGRINETGVDGRHTSRRRRWFYRVDFEARFGPEHWRFTRFDRNTSQEARELYISERVKQIEARMRTRAKTPQEKAEPLVRVTAVQPVSGGATQQNVTGEDNWAVPKGTGVVVVEATLAPEAVPGTLVNWEVTPAVGEVVPDEPKRYSVPIDTSRKVTLTASAGGSSATVHLWVIWAEGSLRCQKGTMASPGNAAPGAGPEGYCEGRLGPLNDEDDEICFETMGETEIIFTITPAGAYQVVKDGWDMRRDVRFRHYNNGQLIATTETMPGDRKPDNSGTSDKDLIPDADGRIYDIDGPAVGNIYGGPHHTGEHYANF